MNKIALIIKREYWTRVRKPSFLIMTILGPLLLIGGIVAVVYATLHETGDHRVLVVDPGGLVTGKLKSTEQLKFAYSPVDIDDTLLTGGPYTLKALLADDPMRNTTVELKYIKFPSQFVQNQISSELERVLHAEKLKVNNYDPEKFKEITRPLEFKLLDATTGGDDGNVQARAGIGFAFGYLIFFFVFLYGIQVMRGVMEEKQNRVVEVLVSSVKPFQLMMGKIIGIAMVGLTQFLLWVVVSAVLGTVAIGLAHEKIAQFAKEQQGTMMTTELQRAMDQSANPSMDEKDNVKKIEEALEVIDQLPIAMMLGLFVFYFLGGYLLYSSLYAAVGSAVDSESDSQQFMLPVTLPMMLSIFVAQTAVANPDGPAVFWCSIIPFTSPVVMLVRVAMGDVLEHPWQLVLSMVLLVATFIFTTWLAGRIYRTGILMYGKKVSWKELGKWLFYRG